MLALVLVPVKRKTGKKRRRRTKEETKIPSFFFHFFFRKAQIGLTVSQVYQERTIRNITKKFNFSEEINVNQKIEKIETFQLISKKDKKKFSKLQNKSKNVEIEQQKNIVGEEGIHETEGSCKIGEENVDIGECNREHEECKDRVKRESSVKECKDSVECESIGDSVEEECVEESVEEECVEESVGYGSIEDIEQIEDVYPMTELQKG